MTIPEARFVFSKWRHRTAPKRQFVNSLQLDLFSGDGDMSETKCIIRESCNSSQQQSFTVASKGSQTKGRASACIAC